MDAGQQIVDTSKLGNIIALCMSCHSEFPIDTENCPTCHVSVSLVRNCPGCRHILSAKHAKCPYCGYVFVQPVAPAARDAGGAAREVPRPLGRRIAAAAVSIGVFLAVFIGADLFTRYQEKRVAIPAKIASTYALRDATIYRDAIHSAPELGHVKPSDVVDVVGYRLAGQDLQWYQVAWAGRPGYTSAKDFAPPKVETADGSRLLGLAIVQLRSPELIGLGREAVEYYRHKFPQSPDADHLLWLLAERTRELSGKKHDQELSRQAREQYQQLASREGELGDNARKRLRELAAAPAGEPSPTRDKSIPPAIQIVDGSTYSGSPQHTGAHQITLVDQTELSIRLPQLADLAEGVVLQGQVAKSVRAGNEIAVRAGSICRLRVVQLMQDRKSALLQLISLDVGNRRVAVSPPPVVVPVSSTPPKPVIFRLPTPLVIPE